MADRGAPEGNKNSSAENRIIGNQLRKLLAQDALKGDASKVRKALEKQLEKAELGDRDALEFLSDRSEGKPTQPTAHSGNVTLTLGTLDERL